MTAAPTVVVQAPPAVVVQEAPRHERGTGRVVLTALRVVAVALTLITCIAAISSGDVELLQYAAFFAVVALILFSINSSDSDTHQQAHRVDQAAQPLLVVEQARPPQIPLPVQPIVYVQQQQPQVIYIPAPQQQIFPVLPSTQPQQPTTPIHQMRPIQPSLEREAERTRPTGHPVLHPIIPPPTHTASMRATGQSPEREPERNRQTNSTSQPVRYVPSLVNFFSNPPVPSPAREEERTRTPRPLQPIHLEPFHPSANTTPSRPVPSPAREEERTRTPRPLQPIHLEPFQPPTNTTPSRPKNMRSIHSRRTNSDERS